MNAPTKFSRVVNGKRYNTETATLLADDVCPDGNDKYVSGRNTFLYVTPRGAYFTVTLTRWQGERDQLTPVDQDEAQRLYEGPLSEQHYVKYEEAFPSVVVEEAAGPGRPNQMKDGRTVSVYLSAGSIDLATQLGGGNISAGIRKALKLAYKLA